MEIIRVRSFLYTTVYHVMNGRYPRRFEKSTNYEVIVGVGECAPAVERSDRVYMRRRQQAEGQQRALCVVSGQHA